MTSQLLPNAEAEYVYAFWGSSAAKLVNFPLKETLRLQNIVFSHGKFPYVRKNHYFCSQKRYTE